MAINDPRDIPGLVLWYSAEAEAANYANGAQLGTVTDWSGNGNHGTLTNPNASTTWKNTGGPSGGASFRFGYYDSRITLPTGVMTGKTAGEIHQSVKVGANDSSHWQFSNQDGRFPFGSGQIYEEFGTTSRKDAINPGVSLTSWRRYNVWSAANDYAIRIDGTSVYTSASNSVTWQATPVLVQHQPVGGQVVDLAFVALFGRKLTTTERADLETWLAANPSGGVPAAPAATGTISATLPALSANLSGGVTYSGTITATLPSLGANLSGTSAPPGVTGTLAATLPSLGGSLTGAYSDTATLSAVLPSLSADLTGSYAPPPTSGTLDALLPSLSANLAGQAFEPGVGGFLAAILPALSASFSGGALGRTGLGIGLDSDAVLTVVEVLEPEPTVPAGTPSTVLHVIAPTVPVPTLVAGRPQ